MTNIIKRKGLLSLIAVVVMIAMMSIACKNRSTGISLSVEELPEANTSEVLTPSGTLTIEKNRGAMQFDGKYFESKTYRNNDGTEFKYTIEFKNQNDEYNSTLLIFNGYENGSKVTDRLYSAGGNISQKAGEYKSTSINYVIKENQYASTRVYNDTDGTWVEFKPNNYNFTIKLALKNK